MRNKDKRWFDDQCRHGLGLKQEAHVRWTRDRSRDNWEEFVRCQVRANETNSVAKRQFSDRNRDVLMNVLKDDLLSGHFDSKQSREAVDLPLTCHQSPSLTTFALRLSEVRRLLLNLDPYGSTDPLGMFPLILERTADLMAPVLV